MNSGAEVSKVELSAEDAAIAMHAYRAHGHRIVGLEYDGTYCPELEEDGRLIVDSIGASALKACVFENVKYNLDILYGKWVDSPEGSRFKPGFIERNLMSDGVIKPSTERDLAEVAKIKSKLRNSQRVNIIFAEYLEQENIEEAAA